MWIGKNSLPARRCPSPNLGRVWHESYRSFVWQPARHILFSPFSRSFLAVTLVQQNLPMRSAEAPVLIWDIDLTLARDLPRNVRTTDDPLRASDGKTPSTTGLIDLHASGSGEFTADNLKLLLARTTTMYCVRLGLGIGRPPT
jgi:hypothetical protein